MSDQYRLTFSGEVTEGQHQAVVKKRLAAVLKLDDERMDILFSGKQVVVKKAVDEQTAARYQKVFAKAGARLRVLPLESAAAQAPAGSPSGADDSPPSGQSGLTLMPEGSAVLTEAERQPQQEQHIDTSHLSVEGASFTVPEPATAHPGPNLDHITVAELGANLGPETTATEVVIEINVNFTLAEVGAILAALDDKEPLPSVDLDSIHFDVAQAGADLGGGTSVAKPAPPPPDTSHIQLEQPPEPDTQDLSQSNSTTTKGNE